MEVSEARSKKMTAEKQMTRLLEQLEKDTETTVTKVTLFRFGKDRVSTDRICVQITCKV